MSNNITLLRVLSVSLVLLITSAYLLKTAEAREKRDIRERIANRLGSAFRIMTAPMNYAQKAVGTIIRKAKEMKSGKYQSS